MKGSISSTPRTNCHPCMGRRYEPPSYLTHANTLNMITPDFNDIPPGSRPRIVTTASATTSRIGFERFGTRKNKSHEIKSANEILLLATETQVPFKGPEKSFMASFYECVTTVLRLQSHHEETVYFLPVTIQT